MTKYIFVTGGVVSGLGKGITAASLGRLLKQSGLKVAAQKLDPYMNVDPGTISPYQHGEVFVTDDGAETDLDLGHYERFIDEDLNVYSNLTSGKVYWNVLNREREGGYLGQTVQVIPHITNEIKRFIYANAASSQAEVLISEIGGTVGDIESQPFLEAIRQVAIEQGRSNCLFIHVSYVPFLSGSDELKTKPTQHSVKELRALGISPDIIVARADKPLNQGIRQKISLFCNVAEDCVIENRTLDSLYAAPLMLHENGLDAVVRRGLGLEAPAPTLTEWRALVGRIYAERQQITIAIVGKYVQLHDAYLSLIESLNHAGIAAAAAPQLLFVDSEQLCRENVGQQLAQADGVIIPGGFGERGMEGKLAACTWARENKVPLLGICLGMQAMVIEFSRDICGLANATSGEFDAAAEHKVIDLMPEQVNIRAKGGTMRLGAYPAILAADSLIAQLYGQTSISERHRHRYEVNNDYRATLTAGGLRISGLSPDKSLVETVELPGHPFYVGVQYHPEFKSRPNRPHPLFLGLVKAAMKKSGEEIM